MSPAREEMYEELFSRCTEEFRFSIREGKSSRRALDVAVEERGPFCLLGMDHRDGGHFSRSKRQICRDFSRANLRRYTA